MVLQKILMTAASLSAMKVLFGNHWEQVVVRPELCVLSLVLNFIHRHHDVSNTIGIAVAFGIIDFFNEIIRLEGDANNHGTDDEGYGHQNWFDSISIWSKTTTLKALQINFLSVSVVSSRLWIHTKP